MDLGKCILKTFRKGSTILGALKNICDSWKEIKNANTSRDSNLHGWLWGVQNFREGRSCKCGGNDSRKPNSRDGGWNATLNCHSLTVQLQCIRSGFLWISHDSGSLRWNLSSVKTCEETIKDFKYYINLMDKAVANFKKIDSSFWKKFYCE